MEASERRDGPSPAVLRRRAAVARIVLAGLAGVALHTGAARAGVCPSVGFDYCVAGNSTGADWSWSVATLGNTVDASAAGLSSGDPPADIVSVMVADLNTKGVNATVGTPNTCFNITSCYPLAIDGNIVPQAPATISFNPLITQVVPEPGSTLGLAAGVLGLAALRAWRSRPAATAAASP